MSIPIKGLGLSRRTVNALERTGVTNIEQLRSKTDKELSSTRGLGATGIKEIKQIMSEDYNPSDGAKYHSISEYWQNEHAGRYQDLLCDFFCSDTKVTLDSVAKKYGTSRERIRQLLKRQLDSIRNAFASEVIDNSILEKIDSAAKEVSKISSIGIEDELFGQSGVARLMEKLYPTQYEIISDDRLKNQWLARKDNNVSQMLNVLIESLGKRPDPVRKSDLLALFQIKEELLEDIKTYIEKDGFVTLSTNKEAARNGIPQIIYDFLDRIERPATTDEIVESTGLSDNQVRGTVSRLEDFQNIGPSIYDLSARDYSDDSISDLCEKYILARQKAVKWKELVNFIKRHKVVDDSDVVKEIITDDKFDSARGYVFLKAWGISSIQIKTRKRYDIPIYDAVYDVINSSDEYFDIETLALILKAQFGEKVSLNNSSIRNALSQLYKEEKIIRVGGSSGLYRKAR